MQITDFSRVNFEFFSHVEAEELRINFDFPYNPKSQDYSDSLRSNWGYNKDSDIMLKRVKKIKIQATRIPDQILFTTMPVPLI